jgi:UDP-GlcNAc:undecaprenyl-phosphate/decaprenyl-phosphate GlcNAc-1-phosphate transferase
MSSIISQSSGGRIFTADEVLSPYTYVFYAAFLIAWIFTPIMRSIAIYYGIVDQPDQLRKIHKTPVAYLGGVAVFLGWISGLAVSQFLLLHRNAPGLSHVVITTGIVAGACTILLLGLWDDLRKIRPWVKITGQVAAAVMLLSSGIGLHITDKFLEPLFLRTELYLDWHPSKMALDVIVETTSGALVVALVVFCCNATNLMDGLDGLCGGVTGIIATGFVILAVYVGMYSGGTETNNDALRVVIALAVLGGVLGFVPYNSNPASIFMGDTGSMFLGFSCALMIILMGEVAFRWLLAAMVMFALPILDTSLAFARRWVNHRPVFSPDKNHFHHQLVARGMSVRKAVLFNYILAIGFVLCGTAIVYMRTRYAVGFYLVIFGWIVVAAYKMGMVHERPVVVTRKPIEQSGAIASPSIEPANVLEVRESDFADRPTGMSIPGAWTEGGHGQSQGQNQTRPNPEGDESTSSHSLRR